MSSIANDVERGISVRKEIETLEVELKEIEGRLKRSGIENPDKHEELNDPEREGRQFMARSSKHVVPVVFTADILIGSFQNLSPLHSKLKVSLGAQKHLIEEFFKAPSKWENRFDSGKKFRQAANDALGAQAPAFITACVARDKEGIAKSAIKVDWERAGEL